MYKVFFIAILIGFCAIGSINAQNAAANLPVMTFDKRYVDLGKVKKGEKRTIFYEFTNTGKGPLEIDLVSACECTTTDYPIKPIAPGKKGRIEVIFDSKEKDEEETIDIDIYLKNIDPLTEAPIFEQLQYHFDIIK